MKQAHVCLSECRLNLNAKDSVMVPDIVTLKKNQNQISPDRFTPLMLMMLAACGGGGSSGGGLGKPKVRVADDGIVFSKVWENTKLVHEDSRQDIENVLEKNSRAIAAAVGKSPGKVILSDINVAPDGQSATFRVEYSNPEFSFLSQNVKVELVGDDAKLFRLVELDGLGSKIEFINKPNYERPHDKNADNSYDFSLKYTFTSDDGGTPETESYRYFVYVINATGKNDPGEESEISRKITLPENTTDEIANNSLTLTRLNNLHNVFFKNSESSEDGSSATIKMHDKKTGRISEVTVKITGPDAAHIQILGGNKLYFRTAPDYEKPADSDGNNIYEFSLVYTGLKSPETTHFRITITDIDELGTSQSLSSQNVEIIDPDPEYNTPETDDIPTPADII